MVDPRGFELRVGWHRYGSVYGEKPAEERRQVERFSSKLSVDLRVLTLPCSSWQFKFAYYQKCIEYGILHEPNLFGNEAKIYGRV